MNWITALLLSLTATAASAQILSKQPKSCLDQSSQLTAPQSQQLVFNKIWYQFDIGQLVQGQRASGFDYSTRPPVRDSDQLLDTGKGHLIRFVLTGATQDESQGYSNTTNLLSTIDIDSNILTFPLANNQSALCSSIRTPSAETGTTTNGTSTVTGSGCPYGPGEIALGLQVPLAADYALTTIATRLLILDPSNPALHLACYDLDFTPYYPDYFPYQLIKYLIIGLLALYFLAYLVARVWAAHTHFVHESETQLATSLTLKISSTERHIPKKKALASVWYSAWAARQVIGSGSLRRFITAEFRELWHVALWWTLVGTVAVSWPDFVYPVFARSSWTSLVYNNSLPFTSPGLPLLSANATTPTTFAAQMGDTTSPLYLNSTLPDVLLDFHGKKGGVSKWATAIGVRPQDLWSICAFTFFLICAAVVGLHLVFFVFDSVQRIIFPDNNPRGGTKGGGSPRFHFGQGGGAGEDKNGWSPSDKNHHANGEDYNGRGTGGDMYENGGVGGDEYMLNEGTPYGEARPLPENDYPMWLLHASLLQGNLTRVLCLFHLPLTLFSVFELSNDEAKSSSTFILAALTLAIVCVILPAVILWRIHRLSVRELYTSLPVLLSIGTLYSGYSDECTMFGAVRFVSNLVVGVVVGAAQQAGTAQAAVILLVEVTDTLVTSLWLPWGDNASMGPLAFGLSIGRIIIAVLLVVLSPSVGVSSSAASWLAYIILLIQGLMLLLLLVVLAFKVVELSIRLIGNVPFDESRSARSGGLHGALRKWDRGGGHKKRGKVAGGAQRRREIEDRRRRNFERQGRLAPSEDTVGTQARMLRDGRPTHQHQQSGTTSSMSSYAADYAGRPSLGQAPSPQHFDDDGYIMSAMSNNNSWGQHSQGHFKTPSTYSGGLPQPQHHQQPILRAGPVWGEATIVQPPVPLPPVGAPAPAPKPSTSTSGFTRVGGGRASSSNPYQLANAGQTAYPPYPSSSADVYSNIPQNPRRMSQSAVIEMASAIESNANYLNNQNGNGGGQQVQHQHQHSQGAKLFSNEVKPYRTERRPSMAVAPAPPKGFFGRFRKPQRQLSSSDFASDDEDESEDEGGGGRTTKRGGWGFGFGKKRKGKNVAEAEEEEEEEPSTGEVGFVVTRKARPRPNVPPSPVVALESPRGDDPLLGEPSPGLSAGPSDLGQRRRDDEDVEVVGQAS
ncbi:hypothetical protein T439DRAFT_345182 [Meredithblackwellia eburnea MCA 4105]